MKPISYFFHLLFLTGSVTTEHPWSCLASGTVATPAASHGRDSGAMRFCLTESERHAVAALKAACDKDDIHYKHVFELAKYVLVSKSDAKDSDPKAGDIRLESALKRLKKRHTWRMKHDLHKVDPHKALLEMDKECPGFIVNRYNKDKEGRTVIAHHHAFAPTDYVYANKKNKAKYFAAEQYRMDLGAADMDEARKGIIMLSISEDQLNTKRAFRYLKFVKVAQDNLKDMHPNDIRKVYSQVPSFLSFMVSSTKKILPRKIGERINVISSMDKLHSDLEQTDKDDLTIQEWVRERLEKYEETLKKLTLE